MARREFYLMHICFSIPTCGKRQSYPRKSIGLTTPTVTQALGELQKLGIVSETTGRVRGWIFAYVRYLDALNAEIETPPP
jgi:hypothetical protein